jgi:transcriptional regulator
MYLPPAFAETDPGALYAGIRAWPLATIVETGAQGIDANHLPLVRVEDDAGISTLRGHAPLQNPVGDDAPEGKAVLVIFHGPSAYITPSWYPAKQEHGRVVPTWNYQVIHVHGRMRIIRDRSWVRAQIEALTRQQESSRNDPWQVSDAPAEYVDSLVNRLKGIEITIGRIIGKTKASQNQPEANRLGVLSGLLAESNPAAAAMAAAVGRKRLE